MRDDLEHVMAGPRPRCSKAAFSDAVPVRPKPAPMTSTMGFSRSSPALISGYHPPGVLKIVPAERSRWRRWVDLVPVEGSSE